MSGMKVECEVDFIPSVELTQKFFLLNSRVRDPREWFVRHVTHEPSLFPDSLFTQVVIAIHRISVLCVTNH
jgi:hypothetical protein